MSPQSATSSGTLKEGSVIPNIRHFKTVREKIYSNDLARRVKISKMSYLLGHLLESMKRLEKIISLLEWLNGGMRKEAEVLFWLSV